MLSYVSKYANKAECDIFAPLNNVILSNRNSVNKNVHF